MTWTMAQVRVVRSSVARCRSRGTNLWRLHRRCRINLVSSSRTHRFSPPAAAADAACCLLTRGCAIIRPSTHSNIKSCQHFTVTRRHRKMSLVGSVSHTSHLATSCGVYGAETLFYDLLLARLHIV